MNASSWLDGTAIDLAGRKKVIVAAGISSRTGDAMRQFGGFARYLQRSYGFRPGDFLEASYGGRSGPSGWVPTAYGPADCEGPLERSAARVAQHLRWYDARLPLEQELCLVGYSLGGVMLFRAAVDLLGEDFARWRGRLRALITLASPHFGCDLGAEGGLLGLLGLDALLPGGAVGRELCALGGDPAHRARVEREAGLLRQAGLRLVTLADENDVVVTPEDAVIAPPDERAGSVLSSSRAVIGGAYADALLGHGPLLDNPKAWALMAAAIGPQESTARTSSGAIPL